MTFSTFSFSSFNILSTLLLAACTPPRVEQAAPMELKTSRSQREVVPLVARALLTSGYEIITSDATGGLLIARRDRKASEFGADIQCNYTGGLATWRRVVLTVSLTAMPGDSTTIQTSTAAHASDFDRQKPASIRLPDSDSECASSGAVEKRIADAVR